MKHNRVASFLILMIILSFMVKPSFAQQAAFSPREDAMNALFSLLQAQARDQAIRDSLKGAEMKLTGNKLLTKEKKTSPRLGGLRLQKHPYLILETAFDDNVDSTQYEKKTALTHEIKPGLRMNVMTGGKSFYVDSYIDSNYNFKRPTGNSQLGVVNIATGFPIGRFTLALNNAYNSNYISTPELGIKRDQYVYYWKNTFTSLLGRRFNRYSFDIRYSRADLNNEKDANLDNNVQEICAVNQSYRILSKTQVYWEYDYGRTKYTHKYIPGAQYNDNKLGLSKVFSYKVSGGLKLGYKLDDYKQGNDSRTTTLTGNLGYRVSKRTDLSLSFSQITFEPVEKTNYYLEKTFNLLGHHRLAFNPKFKLTFSYGAEYWDYPKKYAAFIQENAIYNFSLGLDYAFRRWLDFTLTFGHTKRDSNLDFDYTKNGITLRTEARF